MFYKLKLAMSSTKLEVDKQSETSTEFLIASLDVQTYFTTMKKVSEETNRRKEVNSQVSKLWLAMRSLALEENSKRQKFNSSKHF